jgi:ribosome recycling factor
MAPLSDAFGLHVDLRARGSGNAGWCELRPVGFCKLKIEDHSQTDEMSYSSIPAAMSHPILTDAQNKMKKAVDHTLHEFSAIHTGKATPTMVEGVMIEAYGSMMRLKDCAAISTPDARLIQIQPWDAGLVKAIVKGIQEANLGFNPVPDGKVVRIPLPEMSRERRQEFVKTAHRLAEEGRVHVRNIRRDILETLKKAKLPEDESKRVEKDIQTATDAAIKSINDHLAHKEKDLLTV